MASRLSVPSTSSLTHTSSVRSHRPPPINIVITSPRPSFHHRPIFSSFIDLGSLFYYLTAWAKDEPPSPKELTSINDNHNGAESRPSDVASYQSTSGSASRSRWWAFTLPRPRQQTSEMSDILSPLSAKHRKTISFKDRSMSWLPHPSVPREGSSFARRSKDPNAPNSRDWNLAIPLPTPAAAPFTLSHTATPGWDAPWTARTAAQGPRGGHFPATDEEQEESAHHSSKDATVWRSRKKRLRVFILNNIYVPLVRLFHLAILRNIQISPTSFFDSSILHLLLLPLQSLSEFDDRRCDIMPWVLSAVRRMFILLNLAARCESLSPSEALLSFLLR